MLDIYREIGTTVRQERTRLGWTQEELGERCGMHPAYIGQIERGVKKISIVALQKLSQALRVTMGELLCDPGHVAAKVTWESKIGGLLRDKPESQRRLLYSTLRHLAKEIKRKKK